MTVTFETDDGQKYIFFTRDGQEYVRWIGFYGASVPSNEATVKLGYFVKVMREEKKQRLRQLAEHVRDSKKI